MVELVEALETEQSLRLYYQQELERINQLPYSQGEQKMQLLDRINYFLECSTNLIFFGKFKPTSPWKF
ncbi:MAG TPA: hypothetical protein V6D14_15790 [Coleofasciculaceae cyanobacterium]